MVEFARRVEKRYQSVGRGHSSEEVSVMEMERRASVIPVEVF